MTAMPTPEKVAPPMSKLAAAAYRVAGGTGSPQDIRLVAETVLTAEFGMARLSCSCNHHKGDDRTCIYHGFNSGKV